MDGYAGAGLAWKARENERKWEGFNGENYRLDDNKEVYDAALLGIAMAIRHATQRFGTDTQKITVFKDSQAALHRIKNDKEGSGQAFTRMVYRWERGLLKKNPTIGISTGRYLDIEVTRERSSRQLGKTGCHGAGRQWKLKRCMGYHLVITYKPGSQRKMPNSQRKLTNDSLDNQRAYQLRQSLGMRKEIKDASKKMHQYFFSWHPDMQISEKDWEEGI
jgi:hypothetical protein